MARLFDRLRNGILPARQSAQPYREQGVAGFVTHAGVPQTNETNWKLLGSQRWKTASDMLANVSIIAAGLRYSLNLTARPKWKADPADESDEAKKLAEFAQDVIENTDRSWSKIVRSAAMYRYHGFGINEWVASKRDDGKIGIQTIESRPQHTIERWDLDDNGGVKGVWQRDPITSKELYLPRAKIVYLVDDMFTDRPDGFGLMRHLVEPAHAMKVLLKLERIGFQRDLVGIPIGRVPLGELNSMVSSGRITAEQRDAMIEGIRDFVSLETKADTTGLLLDSDTYVAKTDSGTSISSVMKWGVDLVEGEQASIEALGAAIKRLEFEMALVMGTSSLLTGREGEGSRALSEDQSRNLYLTVNQSLRDMAEAFDRDIMGPLWAMNGFKDELRPKLTTEDASFKDVEQIAAVLQKMAAAGAVLAPDDPAINDLRNLMGVSEAEEMSIEDLALIRGAGKTPPGEEGGEGGAPPGKKPGGKPANDDDAPRGAEQRRGRTAAAKLWDESQHPRDRQGRFTFSQTSNASYEYWGNGKLYQSIRLPSLDGGGDTWNLYEITGDDLDLRMGAGDRNHVGEFHTLEETEAAARRLIGTKKYDPNQPRDPAGSPTGGQWTDGGASVLFEIAPNPDNKELVQRWNALSDGQKQALTDKLTGEFAPQVLDALGVKGTVEDALGGFEGEVNPSLVLNVSERPFEVAGAIGDAFQQKAMVVMSDSPGEGLEPVGIVSVLATGASAAQLRKMQGEVGDLADGWTYHNGRMQMLNFSGKDNATFAAEVDRALGGAYMVEHSTVYSAYVEEKDYARPGGSGKAGSWGQVRGHVREAFSQRLEEELGGKAQKGLILWKFDPNQPRDPAGTSTGGQWTSSGGGPVMVKDTLGNTAPVDPNSSLAKFLVKNPDGSYSLDPEREKLHDEIVAHYLSGVTPTVGQPEMYMTGGGPASGKSSVLMGGTDVLLPGKYEAVHVDPDAIKFQLPEMAERLAAGDKGASSFVHEESSLVRRRLEARAIAGNYNVVLDTTGDSSVDKLERNISAYRDAGYKITAIYATNDVNLASRLAHERGIKTGRFVPDSFLRDTHRDVTRTFVAAAQEKRLFDRVQLVDTNVLGQPRLVATGDRNSFSVRDEQLWKDFVAKGKDS